MKGALLAGLVLLWPGDGRAALGGTEIHRYTILSQDLRAVLEEFGVSLDLSVNVDPDIEGQVTNFRSALTVEGFLDRLTSEHGLVWYFDGTTLHITPARNNRSIFVDFRRVTPAMLIETLDTLAVADDRFTVRSTGSQGIGVVTGPPRYIELVEHAFTLLQSQEAGPQATDAPPARPVMVVRGGSVQLWEGRNTAPANTEAAPPTEAAPDTADESSAG